MISARAVLDEHASGSQMVQVLEGDAATRLIGERQMQRHDVTGGHEVVDAIDERDLGIRSERVGVHMRVPNLDSHAKTVGDARHMLPDATESHKTKRFAGELGAEHTMPTALAHLRVELSYMARNSIMSAMASSATAASPYRRTLHTRTPSCRARARSM